MKRYLTKAPFWRFLIFCIALICAACENTAGPEDTKNSDAAILHFNIGEMVGAISGTDIALWAPPETDKTGLSPEISLSRNATVTPPSGSPRNFSVPVTYTVTAEDGGTQKYTVTIKSESSLNPPAFNAVEAMADYLFAFEGKNNKDTPVNIALSLDLETLEGVSRALNNANDWLGAVFDNLHGKYIRLDLSACAGNFMGGIGTAAEIQATTRARRDADKLVEIILPAGETDLPDYIFSHISGLRRIRLPADMEILPTGAFLACISLEELDCNGAPLTIGERAFSGCISLERIANSSGIRELRGYAFENCPALSAENFEVLLNPDAPLILGDYAFAGCLALTSLDRINIGAMGIGVFENCTNLVSVTIPDSVTQIGRYAFLGCANLVSVAIPDSVAAIGQRAFGGCTSLASIAIPNSVTSTGGQVFQGCTNLASITLPESLASINESLFNGCISLTSVTIPDSVTQIGRYAFQDCTNLASVTLPESLMTIRTLAFASCTSLTIVNVLRSSSQGITMFWRGSDQVHLGLGFSSASLAAIYVPDDDSVAAYKAALGWDAFAGKIKKAGT
jgi:hypothetical protein